MSEAVLQVLLLLAYLAIALISVTFPIYAICVSYLRREFWENLKEQKKRAENLKGNISRLMEELSGERKDSERFKEIEREIRGYKAEVEKAPRWVYLSAAGVVIIPVGALINALVLTCIGIYFFYEGLEGWTYLLLGVNVTLCGGAIWTLCKAVLSVEYAAMRPAHTVGFKMGFAEWETEKRVKCGDIVTIEIKAITVEEFVEKFYMVVELPPEFETQELTSKDFNIIRLPHRTMITYERDYLPRGIFAAVRFTITPKKVGTYRIPVIVCGKGIYDCEGKLVLNVVK